MITRTAPTRTIRVLFGLIIWLLPMMCFGQSGQTVDGNKLIDHDWKFSLLAPESGVLCQEQIAAEGRLGTRAAIFLPAALYLEVSISPAPQDKLDDLPGRFQNEFGLSTVVDPQIQRETFCDHSVLRYSGTGINGGRETGFHSILLKKDGYSLCAVLWDHDPASLNPKFSRSALGQTFRLLKGKLKPRQLPKQLGDGHGPGWTIKDGNYVNSVFGFEIRSAEGCHVQPRDRLGNPHWDTEVVYDLGQAWIKIYCAASDDKQNKRFEESVHKTVIDSGTFKRIEKKNKTGQFANRSAEFRAYSITNSPYLAWRTGFVVNGTAYTVDLSYRDLTAKIGEQRSFDMLKNIRIIPLKERAKLKNGLNGIKSKKLATTQNDSYFNRVYRNFEHGFAFSSPRGLWRIAPSDLAAKYQQGASLHLRELNSNLNATVYVVSGWQNDNETAFHKFITDTFEGTLGQPRKCNFGNRDGLQSDVLNADSPEYSYRVMTTIVGDRGFVIYAWCEKYLTEKARPRIETMAEQFRFFSRIPAKTKIANGAFRDHRMRYEFMLRDGQIESHESPIEWNDDDRSYHKFSFPDSLLVNILAVTNLETERQRQLRFTRREMQCNANYGKKPIRSESMIAGQRATQLTWKTNWGFMSMFNLSRGNTFCSIVVMTKDKTNFSQIAKGFRFLN